MNAMAKSIVVLGDSISAGYGIETGKDWVTLLSRRLDQLESGYQVFNESISGDTTAGGAARVDQVLAKHRPKVLILELGANDGLRGLSIKMMKKNLAVIIDRAQQDGVQVLLVGMRIPPNLGKRYTDMFYQVYPQLAAEHGVSLVPFILEDIALANDLMQSDRLHPGLAAQPLILDKIWPYLQKLL